MNSQAFTPEEVEQGLHLDLLNYLLDYNKKAKDGYYDIHITSDGYCTIIEWTDINWDFKDEEAKFVLLKSDEYIMKEIRYPDDHYEMVYPEEAEEKLAEWHKEHPEWVMTPYGTWTNMEENRRAQIAFHADEWTKRKVEENDSTFTESLFSASAPVLEDRYNLEAVIGSVNYDILRRTDYVIMSKKVADYFQYSGERSDDNIEKLEDVEIVTHIIDDNKPGISIIHVYVTDYLTDDPNSIYYLTENHCLIHKLKIARLVD